jgi:hypothetical protein
MKVLFSLLLVTLSLTVSAAVSKMAVITSEFDRDVRDYYLETDNQNAIHSMRYTTTNPNGGISEDVTVSPEQVMENGIVVFEHKGYKAVILELENFNVSTGGTIKINYLFSGVTGQRLHKRLSLKLVNGEFLLFDGEKRVNKMFFIVNRSRVLGVIGVKEIQTTFDSTLRN